MRNTQLNQLLSNLGRRTGTVPRYESHFLADAGGDVNAVSNYSGTTEPFFYTPGAGNAFRVHRLLVTIEDTDAAADTYGNIATLSNGIQIAHCTGLTNVINDLTDSQPVKSNVGWGSHCYDVDHFSFGSPPTGNQFILVRWTFTKGGAPIRLSEDEYFTAFCNDDLTGLIRHNFVIQGYLE